MEIIKRDHCVISEKEDFELLYSFKDFPVFVGCVDQPLEKDIKADMNWWISRSTGNIQLNPLIPPEILYSQSHGSGSVGELWRRHHLEFAHLICKYSSDYVLEIGGGHGILAQNCLQIKPNLHWTIVEPNPTVPANAQIKVVKRLFDETFIIDKNVDTIVHSHVLEHIYEPNQFMSQISRNLERGKNLLFSVPNLQIMMQRKYTNCINFEHTVFLTEPFIEYILQHNGFKIKEKRYFLDDHSIFYAAIRDDAAKGIAQMPDEYSRNKQAYMDYIQYHSDLIKELNQKMSNQENNVYLFGGHIFSQYLLKFGLDQSRIQCLLDNDPHKHNKRLYGTNMIVYSPKILKDVKNPVVILRAGVFNNEIKKDILENINHEVVFWE